MDARLNIFIKKQDKPFFFHFIVIYYFSLIELVNLGLKPNALSQNVKKFLTCVISVKYLEMTIIDHTKLETAFRDNLTDTPSFKLKLIKNN